MNTELAQPIDFVLDAEIKTANSYTASFVRCRAILAEIETITNSRILAYSSNFKSSYGVTDKDALVIEDLLRANNTKQDLLFILNSPGGSAVAAEKIQLVCQEYAKSKQGTFITLVPKSAKSAATIVALGSDKILLCSTAELGPIDPQIVFTSPVEVGMETEKDTTGTIEKTKQKKLFQNTTNVIPAYRIIKAVEGLILASRWWFFNGSSSKSFLGQYNYDLYLNAKNESQLSIDIMDKILKRKKITDGKKKDAFKIFSEPEKTLSHNRPISLSDLEDSELHTSGFITSHSSHFLEKGVTEQNLKKLDQLIWEYYVRTNTHLEDGGNFVDKTIETCTHRVQLASDGNRIVS